MFIRPTYFEALSSRNVDYVSDVFIPAEDGSTDVVSSSAPPAPLPDYSTQSIDALLKAGVPLERVNPHILGDARPSDDAIVDAVLNLKTDKPASASAAASAPAHASAPAEVAPTDTL